MASWLLAFTPFTALAFNCSIYLIARRILEASLLVSIVVGFAAGFAAALTFIASVSAHRDLDPLDAWVGTLITYTALSFGFWAFLNLNVTSVRIRILRYLLETGGTASTATLLATYSDEERLQRRLSRLVNSGQIVLVKGRWKIRSRAIVLLSCSINALRQAVVFFMGQRVASTPSDNP